MTVATATKPHPIYLAGRWVDSPDVLEVSNPADPDNPAGSTYHATSEQYERLFANASEALEIIAFFKTRFPEHIMRSVRSLAFRANPDAREIELMRAMAIEVVRATERERKQHAAALERALGTRPSDA